MTKNLLLLSGLLAGCSAAPPERDALQGVVELHQRVLGFELSGRLQRLEVQKGQVVRAGQELARLDDALDRPQREAQVAEVAAAQAQLDLLHAGSRSEDLRAAEAQLRGAQANEKTLAETARRARELNASGALPAQQLDDAQGALSRATAEREAAEQRLAGLRAGARSQEVRAAQARLDAAQASLAAVDARLAQRVLRAPVDGQVLDTHAEEGEVLGPGGAVVTVAEVDRPYVDLFVPEARAGEAQVGAPAELQIDAEPGRSFPGAVEFVDARTAFTPRYLFSPKERPNLVVRVRVALRDPEHRLRAGLPVFGHIGAGAPAAGGAP
jgi:HlyD family secretion protein